MYSIEACTVAASFDIKQTRSLLTGKSRISPKKVSTSDIFLLVLYACFALMTFFAPAFCPTNADIEVPSAITTASSILEILFPIENAADTSCPVCRIIACKIIKPNEPTTWLATDGAAMRARSAKPF